MFGFLCSRQLLLLRHRRTQLGFLLQQNGFFIVKLITPVGLSESNKKLEEEKQFLAVSQLLGICGLSTKLSKSAILAL